MQRYIAQFVGADPDTDRVTAIERTANQAIEAVKSQLRERLWATTDPQLAEIEASGIFPERLSHSNFQRDANAVLHGSDDLRPHITVRTLPHNT